MATMNAEQLTRALGGTWDGKSGKARCPAHDDDKPSLSISQTRAGAILVRCHAGCGQENAIRALRSRNLWPTKQGTRAIVAEYDYRDENGALRYQVVRY